MSNIATIASVAGVVGEMIKLIAALLGEPVADVRKRVLAQIEADAADETDAVSAEINAASPR